MLARKVDAAILARLLQDVPAAGTTSLLYNSSVTDLNRFVFGIIHQLAGEYRLKSISDGAASFYHRDP